MCYKQLILITLAIISIALSLKIFYKKKGKKGKKGKKEDTEGLTYDPLEGGIWSNNNQRLIIDNTDRSLYQSQSFSDEGHYFSDTSQINFQNQGWQKILYDQNSLTITETFSRNTSNTSCMDKVTSDYYDCIDTVENNFMICQQNCDGVSDPSKLSICNCTSIEVSGRLNCQQTKLRPKCFACNGVITKAPPSLLGDYVCSANTSKGTSPIGNWVSTNNGQVITLINIFSDNSVQYTMFSGQTDSGTYDNNSSTLILSTQGVKNISYDPSTDTITVSVNMTKSPNNPISTLNGKIFTGWGSNDDLVINYDGSVTALYLGGLNGQIFHVYDSSNFIVEYGQIYKTYRYDPSTNTIDALEDNRVFSRFRPV